MRIATAAVVALWCAAAIGQPAGTLPFQADRLTDIAVARGAPAGVIVVAASGQPLTRVFVSKNGGRDWHAGAVSGSIPSLAAGTTVSSGRISLAFDSRGTLHLAAELFRGAPGAEPRADVYYSSSPDLGSTWTPPVVLDAAGSGLYPRLTIAGSRVFVTAGYRDPYRLHLFWSADSGKTWKRPDEPPGECINTSDVAVVDGTPVVACAGFTADESGALKAGVNPLTGIRVFRLDPAGELRRIATLPASITGVWPRLFAHGRTLILVADVYKVHGAAGKGWDKCCAAVARSSDGGATWSEAVDLRGLLSQDEGWHTFVVRAATLDADGRLHAIVTGSHQDNPANGSPGTGARLVRAAIDTTTLALVEEESITPAVAAPQGFYPGAASLAFGDGGGIVVWASGRDVRYAAIGRK
jgi:hypothetical protein